MPGLCGRLIRVPLLATFALGLATGAAQAASGTTITPANGASVTVTPAAGFANGPLTLQWSAEYGGCPGSDNIHTSAPETRRAGGADTDWQGHQIGGPFFGPGTFTTTMRLLPTDVPQQYEWRVRVGCGATLNFSGMQVYSPIATFTLLPRSTEIAARPIATLPRTPKAGKLLTARAAVVTKEAGTPLTSGTILCPASIGGKSLTRLARGIVGGVAFCRWRVPKSASGKQLRGTITVVFNGERASRSFTRRVAA